MCLPGTLAGQQGALGGSQGSVLTGVSPSPVCSILVLNFLSERHSTPHGYGCMLPVFFGGVMDYLDRDPTSISVCVCVLGGEDECVS